MKKTLLTALLASAPAFADQNITIDGVFTDWASTTTCITDPANDTLLSVDLIQACVENNNTAGTNGSLFIKYTASGSLLSLDFANGFNIDTNNNGVFDSADETWLIHWNLLGAAANVVSVYAADDLLRLSPKRSYTSAQNCGNAAGGNNAWSARRAGTQAEIAIGYGCIGGGFAFGSDERMIQLGAVDTTSVIFYNGSTSTLVNAATPPDVALAQADSDSAQVTLNWTNPSLHKGVVIVRASGSPAAPTLVKNTTYTAGQTIGSWTVVYADDNDSTVATYTDTGLSNGTRYTYRIYNHHQFKTYATGDVPSSSGLFSEPTAQTATSPKWCASYGYPAMQRPVVVAGAAVLTASNAGTLVANATNTLNATLDGAELWRPVQLAAAVQNRPLLVPMVNRVGNYLLTGDQAGYFYMVNSATGALVWTANSGSALGDTFQAQPVTQLFNYADASFKAAHPNRDLIFVGTRNSSTTNNKVYAISSATGAVVWTYAPGNLDIINGGMMVDYTTNRLFVGARSNGGSQASLRVLSTITGAQLATFSVGDVDLGINLDFSSRQAYFVNNAGIAYGYSVDSLTQIWSANIGACTSWLFPTGNGFIASLASGFVRRFTVTGSVVTQDWSTAVAGATGVALDYTNQKAYIGSSDGKLRQLKLTDGVAEKQLTVVTQAPTDIGQPQIDATTGRVHLGTMDGRMCAFGVPLP